MKTFLNKHEDAIIFICFGILILSILSAFIFCGISKEFADQVKDIFSYCLAFGVIFGSLFPFVVLEINEHSKEKK